MTWPPLGSQVVVCYRGAEPLSDAPDGHNLGGYLHMVCGELVALTASEVVIGAEVEWRVDRRKVTHVEVIP